MGISISQNPAFVPIHDSTDMKVRLIWEAQFFEEIMSLQHVYSEVSAAHLVIQFQRLK